MDMAKDIIAIEAKILSEVGAAKSPADVLETALEAYKLFAALFREYLSEALTLEGQWESKMAKMEETIVSKIQEAPFKYELYPEMGVIQVTRSGKTRHAKLVDLIELVNSKQELTLNQTLLLGFLLENNDTVQLYQYFTKTLI
jgi:hypothetical protein